VGERSAPAASAVLAASVARSQPIHAAGSELDA
jgi:hypothetical protein